MEKKITTTEKKMHFGGLDSLRVYGFLIVFISHSYFSFFTITEKGTRRFAHGEIGVHIFFVLSAFLITYLSLREYGKTGKFSIVHFFKKRILRIWPLYFLVIALSYTWHLVRAPEQSLGCMVQFMYFLGNMCAMNGVPQIIGSTTLTPMWSISIEQQFYTVFPLLFVLSIWLIKNIRKVSVHVIVSIGLLALLIYSLYIRFQYASNWDFLSYSTFASLPGFIFGIVLAYAMYKNIKLINHVRAYSKIYAITAIFSFLSAFSIKFDDLLGASLYVLPIIYSSMVYIILVTGNSEGNTDGNKTNILHYLGQISYGLYAYHMFAIVFLQYLALSVSPVFESVLALVITVILAHVSYRYFESYFLRFK